MSYYGADESPQIRAWAKYKQGSPVRWRGNDYQIDQFLRDSSSGEIMAYLRPADDEGEGRERWQVVTINPELVLA